MGLCHGKPTQIPEPEPVKDPHVASGTGNAAGRENGTSAPSPAPAAKPGTPKQPKFPFYLPSPLPPSSYKGSPANSSVASTPARDGFKRPFPPPSPAKHIRALLARRHGSVKPNEASIPEGGEPELGLDKSFGFSKHFFAKYELGEEVGRGHFGYTCCARAKKGEHKGQDVAVKVIPKAKVRYALSLARSSPCDCHVPFSSCLRHLVLEECLCSFRP
jgi:kinase